MSTTQLLIVCSNLSSSVNAIPNKMKVRVIGETQKDNEIVLVVHDNYVSEIRAIIGDYGGYVL
jgi:hypothetical protein